MTRSFKFTAILFALLLVFAACFHFWGSMPWFAPLSLVATAGILPLGATFLGATYAFEYQNNEADKKELISQVVAGRLAAFNLSELYNDILNIEVQILSKHRNKPMAFTEMPPSLDMIMSKASIDFASLYFLLDDDGYGLLGKLSTCMTKHASLIETVNSRSMTLVREAQPLALQAGFSHGGKCTEQQMETALGPVTYHKLKDLTKHLFDESEDTLTFMESISKQLADTLQKRFPKSDFPCILPRTENLNYQQKTSST